MILEVAMVRLTKPELDQTYEAIDERLTRLERGASRSPAPTPAPAPALRPIGSSVTAPAPVAKSEPSGNEAPPDKATPTTIVSSNVGDESLDLEDVRERFSAHVVPRTSRSAQLLLRSARIESVNGLLLTIAMPSEEMRQNTELIAQGLKGALEHEFQLPLSIFWTVDPSLVVMKPAPRAVSKSAVIDDEADGADESAVVVNSAAEHLITEMFPGAEEIS